MPEQVSREIPMIRRLHLLVLLPLLMCASPEFAVAEMISDADEVGSRLDRRPMSEEEVSETGFKSTIVLWDRVPTPLLRFPRRLVAHVRRIGLSPPPSARRRQACLRDAWREKRPCRFVARYRQPGAITMLSPKREDPQHTAGTGSALDPDGSEVDLNAS